MEIERIEKFEKVIFLLDMEKEIEKSAYYFLRYFANNILLLPQRSLAEVTNVNNICSYVVKMQHY